MADSISEHVELAGEDLRYRIIISYDIPVAIMKKSYFYFRCKIFDLYLQEECIIDKVELIKSGHTLQCAIRTEDSIEFQLDISLLVKQDEEFFRVATSISTSPKLSKSNENMRTVKISNPVFGKSRDIIEKASLTSIPQYGHKNLLSLHQISCEACRTHKPCAKQRWRGIHLLPDSNEVEFHIRLMAPTPQSKGLLLKPLVTATNAFFDFVDDIEAQDAYFLLFSLATLGFDKAHTISYPMIIEQSITPEAIGIDAKRGFCSLLRSGLSKELWNDVIELESFQTSRVLGIRESLSGYFLFSYDTIDAELYMFFRKHVILLDIKRFVRRSDYMGNTILHYAALLKLHLLIDFLLEENERQGKGAANLAVVNIADINGRTPLHFAALSGNRSTVTCLLAHHATCSRKDINGKTPFAYSQSINAISVSKLIKRWAQVRETQVLISSLSLEKEKLQQQVEKLEAQAATKKKSRRRALTDSATKVQTNPLFGMKSPTKSMQHGKLEMSNGMPVFTPKRKERKVKRSLKIAQTRRVREHELRSSLEHQKMVNEKTLQKLKEIVRSVDDETLPQVVELKKIIENMKSNLRTLPKSPHSSAVNILATFPERREREVLAIPFDLNGSSNTPRKLESSPRDLLTEKNRHDIPPLSTSDLNSSQGALTGRYFSPKLPKSRPAKKI